LETTFKQILLFSKRFSYINQIDLKSTNRTAPKFDELISSFLHSPPLQVDDQIDANNFPLFLIETGTTEQRQDIITYGNRSKTVVIEEFLRNGQKYCHFHREEIENKTVFRV
jgi:hypothetical protein